MPAPPGWGPFEWGVVVVLVGIIASMGRYLFNQITTRDARDKAESEEKRKSDKSEIYTAIANFSGRVDENDKDTRKRFHDHSSRLVSLGESVAVLESKMADLKAEQQTQRLEQTKQSATMTNMSMRLGMTQSGHTMTPVVPPRRDPR